MARVLSVIALVITLVAHVALRVDAQPAARIFRIGWLAQDAPGDSPADREAFLRRLRSLGYVQGRNLSLERRYALGTTARLSDLAAELVQARVDVIVTAGSPAALAAAKATGTIPIVMVAVGSPVERGLVASLARPGGNVTGLSLDVGPEIGGKRLQLLKEAIPKLAHVAWLGAPGVRPATRNALQTAAQVLGLTLQRVEVASPEDFDKAFAAITRMRPDALFVGTLFLAANRSRIVDFATKGRIPSTYPFREYAEAGGLMSYGPSLLDLHVRAASYVDAILKGTKPGDLPVEQPTRFELVINLKTARALGLTMPSSLLQRADEVIR